MKKFKRCSKCRVVKKIELFHKNRSAKNGVKSRCKECLYKYRDAEKDRKRRALWAKNNPEKAKAKSKKFRTKNPDKQKEYNKRNHKNFRIRYPEKVKADQKKSRDKLSDWYIRKCLKKKGITGNAATKEVIELHRTKILIRRIKKQIIKHEKHNRPKKPPVRSIE